MAERTPRFLYTNRLQAASASIAASSEWPGFPRSRIRTAFASDRWRSKRGWNVITGFNDKIDFTEAGVARVATLSQGNYASGDAAAAHVTTQMNAAPGATNTYLCTYVAPNFDIARASGANAIVLKFLTGANLATSFHLDMGYTSTDKTGALNYTAENPAYHTREHLTWDLGSALGFQGLIVKGHNLLSSGVAKLAANSSNAWTAPALAFQTIAGSGALRATFLAAAETYRFLRLQVDDVSNPDGFSELGVPFAGPWWQPGRSFAQGFIEIDDDMSLVSQGDAGSIHQARRLGPPRHLQVQFNRLSRADRLELRAIIEAVGVGGHLFFATDPQNYPQDETIYGAIVTRPTHRHSPGDGTPPDRYSAALEFLEELH